MIRLGEARARADLSEVILPRHVQEGKRLLKASIAKVEHDAVPVDILEEEDLDEEIAPGRRGGRCGGGGGAGGGAGGGRRGAGARGTQRVSSCSYEKYKKVERSIVLYLRSREEGESQEGEEEGGGGLRQADVVEWYLNQQEELDSLEALAEERRLVRRIIQRLIRIDGVLVVLNEPAEGEPKIDPDDRILMVKGDYNID